MPLRPVRNRSTKRKANDRIAAKGMNNLEDKVRISDFIPRDSIKAA